MGLIRRHLVTFIKTKNSLMAKKKITRKEFIKTSTKVVVGASLLGLASDNLFSATPLFSITPPFIQDPLNYNYDDLEPFIDKTTMEIHYSKHGAGYLSKLNTFYKEEVKNNQTSLVDLLKDISKYSSNLRNNAGGHYNHEMFWKSLAKPKEYSKDLALLKKINENFGSLDAFKTSFKQASLGLFGSGWAWLVKAKNNSLQIVTTPNQDNPLMDVVKEKGVPIFGLDLWEHAYYLKNQNRRNDYIENWWNVLNWDFANKNFENS